MKTTHSPNGVVRQSESFGQHSIHTQNYPMSYDQRQEQRESQLTTYVRGSQNQLVSQRTDPERLIEITKIVAEVEAAKHLREKLTAQQAGALQKTLAQMPWSLDEIRARGEIVKKTDSYGSIGFDKWYNAKPVYSEGEAHELAVRIVERRKRDYEKIKPATEEELLKEGLLDVRTHYASQIAARLSEIEDKLFDDIRDLRKKVKNLPIEKKRELKALLYEKRFKEPMLENESLFSLLNKIDSFWATHESIGALSDDDFWYVILHYFTPWMLKEAREMCE